jgi:hypothetical protein
MPYGSKEHSIDFLHSFVKDLEEDDGNHLSAVVMVFDDRTENMRVYGMNLTDTEIPELLTYASEVLSDVINDSDEKRTLN